ncbi:MAG: alpha-mannosidase [Armatimonadetes bacterium]|nr:alpha-mannosidase [Armatimonadota bacterium]
MQSRIPAPALALLVSALILGLSRPPARADALTDQMDQLAAQQVVSMPMTDWKFHKPDTPGGEAVSYDDSSWQTVAPGFEWPGENTTVWFRTRYVVPATVNGVPTEGAALRFEVGVNDDGQAYVNGKLAGYFHWDDGHFTLAEHARPGQVFVIAVRGINGPGNGGLRHAQMVYDLLGPVQPMYARYARDAQFVSQAAFPAGTRPQAGRVLAASEAQVDMAAIRAHDWTKGAASLAAAQKTLLALAPITRRYDVYYVGHAHIDMNWLWTWPETIDVCHRTWDSAMNLMTQFPDFGFVQSQPGAYAAIQRQYPAEFARMQQEQRRGQWDTVGGLWDESDTDMPSGEGLARSFFLGQRFFKAHFGTYATTGWLPDSFGHSWQLPQLMQGVGIQNFYHMRCGDGVRFSWWQSPDGSRVLKANTDSYDEPIEAGQMTRPWEMERNYGLKEALVVFGVGDHGGGPTRDMILQGREFQNDPLFPKVHFVTADTFFRHLRGEPQTQNLPVVDTDLQYTFVGCYTTHADLKKAVRSSENNLYAAEVFSSLAAMRGQPYPVQGFEDAWKPTAFAQFHDIMCGSAIHSTYDWMHQQLAPAFAFEQSQTDRALAALTATADTRGARPGEQPVVVWNALSFPRSDVVRMTVSDASQYGGARDGAGHLVPAQALDAHTVAFVAADVPAFGHRTYYLSGMMDAAKTPPALAHETGDGIVLENPFLRVTLAKDTGLITSLVDKKTGQEMIAPGQSANLLQVLGDNGSAWDIGYTGERNDLTTGADVQIVSSGPVCAVARVRHTFGKSTFTQDVTLWNDLPRLDVPTTVEWHEHGQLLKVAFPLQMAHPAARVSIPYGSIERPTTGQENPGQKWMDVTEERQETVGTATPLDLTGLYNHRSAVDFDTQRRGYPADLMPAAGVHTYGAAQIPFQMAGEGGPDNIACDGQAVPVPVGVRGDTLYLLGAGAPGQQGGTLRLVRADGRRVAVPFQIGDWVVGGGGRNDEALALNYRLSEAGQPDTASKPHLWIVSVPLPAGAAISQIILPRNPNAHLFALTLGGAARRTPLYGLTVLNDSKYGSDTNGNVFRLTLLRSSHDPDPNPDEGTQTFTYSLLPHPGDWRTAQSEQAGLALNIPLRAVMADAHPGRPAPALAVAPAENIVVGALKHDEDGGGYVLRLFETQGRDTVARLTFSQPVRVAETDILERPVQKRRITTQGRVVTFPVGHDQIVTLRITGLPDANAGQLARR